MSTLYRVEQPKNCNYVGWQTYGKEVSWASGELMWGSAKEAELQYYRLWTAVGSRTLSGRQGLPSALKAVFVDTAAGGLASVGR